MNNLYLITGPAGVGKSTISKELANKLPKSVLIEGDTIYNFFVSDHISPWLPNAPLDLFWSNVIYLIKSYLDNGYNVIFNYIITPEDYKMITTAISDYPIIFKVLLTNEATIIKRDKERPLDCQMHERSLILLKKFLEYNYPKSNLIDTSNLSIEETVDKILLSN